MHEEKIKKLPYIKRMCKSLRLLPLWNVSNIQKSIYTFTIYIVFTHCSQPLILKNVWKAFFFYIHSLFFFYVENMEYSMVFVYRCVWYVYLHATLFFMLYQCFAFSRKKTPLNDTHNTEKDRFFFLQTHF